MLVICPQNYYHYDIVYFFVHVITTLYIFSLRLKLSIIFIIIRFSTKKLNKLTCL